jgi:hypothetical protein
MDISAVRFDSLPMNNVNYGKTGILCTIGNIVNLE